MSGIKLRVEHLADCSELHILLSHPMENGRQRDDAGQLIPAHYIESLIVSVNGHTQIDLRLSGGISKNPYFRLQLPALQPQDRLAVEWLDNLGVSERAELVID